MKIELKEHEEMEHGTKFTSFFRSFSFYNFFIRATIIFYFPPFLSLLACLQRNEKEHAPRIQVEASEEEAIHSFCINEQNLRQTKNQSVR
jgi:hypothetical protein